MHNKEIIKNNFSRSASQYDKYCEVQKIIAQRLIKKIPSHTFGNILDIGCGTGNYTDLLKSKFPHSNLSAIDISSNMINIAKKKLGNYNNIKFLVADAETPAFNETFDLITSNSALQWFNHLPVCLRKYKNLLQKNGQIYFSLFGPTTFIEIRKILKDFFSKELLTPTSEFITASEISNILNSIYKEVGIETELIRKEFNSLLQLFKHIKYTGTQGEGLDKKFLWTPNKVKNLEQEYRRQYKTIRVTYEVIFCEGRKG